MCPGCDRIWTIVHVLWSLVYVTCGAAQLVAGIFFIISIPELHLSCNIWTGSWNIVIGIAAGMVACFGQLSPRRQELLLYMAVSLIAVNTVNAVLTEWCLYWVDFAKLLVDRPYQALIYYACFVTRVAAAIVVIIAFLDSQLAFCSMQTTAQENTKKKLRGSHEQVSDIEYIIPRPKSSKPCSAYNAYAQSWVFDATDNNGSCSNHTNSPYLKLSQNGTPNNNNSSSLIKEPPQYHQHQHHRHHSELEDLDRHHQFEEGPEPSPKETTTHVIGNPVVQIEEASDDSTSNSDRKLNYMKSFSRSTSPAVLSASSSQLSLNANNAPNNNNNNNPPIYECLERLTEASVYRSRLNSALSNKGEEETQYQAPQHQQQQPPAMFKRVEAITPQGEKVQYASLMKELQKAIVSKKGSDVTSPQSVSESTTTSDKTQTNSKSSSRHESSSRTDGGGKNSDAEFSKELEAALQLIQDLESPNTVETPSEPKETRPLAVWKRGSDASDSEKTLSAIGSLGELGSPMTECHPELCTFKPPSHHNNHSSSNSNNGKTGPLGVVLHCDSQSTSGYSSPTHKSSSHHTPNWSTASSVNGSHNDLLLGKPMSYSIHNTKSTAVISLYSQDTLRSNKCKSVTLVNICGDNRQIIDGSSKSMSHSTTLEHLTNRDIQNNNYKTVPPKLVADTTGGDDMMMMMVTSNEPESIRKKTDNAKVVRRSSSGSGVWNVKSILRKKKHQQGLPKLCPELEGAIVKSESLAYLSELELLARHQRNKDIQRQIEQRVLQQLGTPRTEYESNC